MITVSFFLLTVVRLTPPPLNTTESNNSDVIGDFIKLEKKSSLIGNLDLTSFMHGRGGQIYPIIYSIYATMPLLFSIGMHPTVFLPSYTLHHCTYTIEIKVCTKEAIILTITSLNYSVRKWVT